MHKQKRVFIIHGWGATPEEGVFPWLKHELHERGFSVFAPDMPDPLRPKIDAWVQFLSQQIGTPDPHTILFGHSIGAQTILRYLESLPENTKIGGAAFLAPWVHLTDQAYETEGDREIARPWLETPLNWDKIRPHARRFFAIFSDNDPVVPLSDRTIFEKKLGAKIITEHQKQHFDEYSGTNELPSALEVILEIAGKNV